VLPPNSILMCIASLPLVVAYPLMKRVTFWPQLMLGAAFNWGALVRESSAAVAAAVSERPLFVTPLQVGVSAVTGTLGLSELSVVVPLWLGSVCWTIVYDTIYAHQDKDDDAKLGLKSTALLFGDRSPAILSAFAAGSLALWSMAGATAGLGAPFFALGVGGSALHYAWMLATVKSDQRQNCMNRFVSNRWIGWLMLSGVVLDRLTARKQTNNKTNDKTAAAAAPVAAAAAKPAAAAK
jgi:4-hydroxybenzoate polyprenyltransferase